MNPDYSDAEDEDDELSSAFLLPTHSPHLSTPKTAKGKTVRFAEPNPWDERVDLFNIGDDDSDDDDTPSTAPSSSSNAKPPEAKAKQDTDPSVAA